MKQKPGQVTDAKSPYEPSGPPQDPRTETRAKSLSMSDPTSLKKSDPPLTVLEHAGLRLHSAFQPIISVVHSKIVGHEALLRGFDESDRLLTPAELFPQLVATLSAREVNSACARLHLESFAANQGEGWLFLNFSPESLPDRQAIKEEFRSWLEATGIKPHQVVVEIVETRAFDEKKLADAVLGIRELGCLVAIDDFGAGESNFERVWRLRPDIVKLDRAMITEAAVNSLVQRILPGIVSLVHEAGCLVVMEGIETEHQAQIAVESDVDFVQGFYFSRPSSVYRREENIRAQFDELANNIKSIREARSAMDRGFFSSYIDELKACVSALEAGVSFTDACQMFLAVTGVQRIYELDAEGYQVGENAESVSGEADLRFLPCASGQGANWFRRPYFQRAIRNPKKVQISRPYLSIRDARSCVTVSMAFESGDVLRVLCADLDYADALPPSQQMSERPTSFFQRR